MGEILTDIARMDTYCFSRNTKTKTKTQTHGYIERRATSEEDTKLVFSLATSSGMKWHPSTKKKGRQHTTRVSPIGLLAFL